MNKSNILTDALGTIFVQTVMENDLTPEEMNEGLQNFLTVLNKLCQQEKDDIN